MKCFMVQAMVKPVSEVPVATLRYALTPDQDGIAAIERHSPPMAA